MDGLIDDEQLSRIFSKDKSVEKDGHKFKEYVFCHKDFFNKGCIFYGSTGSGKTFLMKDLLFQLSPYFPRVILFSPTAEITGDFENIVHPALIIPELTAETFNTFYDAQEQIAEMYRFVNRTEILTAIFKKIYINTDFMTKYGDIMKKFEQKLNSIHHENTNIMEEQKQKLRTDVNKMLVKFLKACIMQARNNLNLDDFDADEQKVIKHIDLDYNTLVIFDDVQNEMAALMNKKETKTKINNLFTRGRHYGITHFHTLQDDSSFAPGLRKNAKISILTQSSIADSFITRASNGIGKEDQRHGLKLISQLFQTEDDHRKIIFFKDLSGEQKFQYYTAQPRGLFKVNAQIINDFCDKIKTLHL